MSDLITFNIVYSTTKAGLSFASESSEKAINSPNLKLR